MKKFIVSGRQQAEEPSLYDSIIRRHAHWDGEIKSVYGFTEDFTELYGGRKFSPPNALKYSQIEDLNDKGIGFDLAITNHFFSEKGYSQAYPILEKLNRPGNGIVCYNDELALRVKKDFPDMIMRSSCIKEPKKEQELVDILKIYDFCTLHFHWHHKPEQLKALPIEIRSKLIVFVSANCGYWCQNKSCYMKASTSKIETMKTTDGCSQHGKIKDAPFFFDINDPMFEGIEYIKLTDKCWKNV